MVTEEHEAAIRLIRESPSPAVELCRSAAHEPLPAYTSELFESGTD